MAFRRDQVAHTQDAKCILRQLLDRPEEVRIGAVVYDRRLSKRNSSVDHNLPDVFADTQHTSGGVISEARNPAAPLPNTPGNLDVRINIEAMNRNNVRNSQFAMDQHGRVSARKRSVGMNQVKFVLSMEVSNFSDQPRKQKSAAKGQSVISGD